VGRTDLWVDRTAADLAARIVAPHKETRIASKIHSKYNTGTGAVTASMYFLARG
jgi:hypothetical protein